MHIKTGVIWADVLIESSGGSYPLTSHGHRKFDARRIRALVEEAQGISEVLENQVVPNSVSE